jgi:hydrogenase maturation protease
MADVVVIGLGNVLVGDDGFGPFVAQTIDAGWEMADGVAVFDLGTPGFDLGPHIAGIDTLIVIDTVSRTDAEPGTVHSFGKAELLARGPTPRTNPHQPSLVDTLFFLELQDMAPREVLLVGVVPERYDTGAPLSEPVRRAVPKAVARVRAERERLGRPAVPRAAPRTPDIWWEHTPGASAMAQAPVFASKEA